MIQNPSLASQKCQYCQNSHHPAVWPRVNDDKTRKDCRLYADTVIIKPPFVINFVIFVILDSPDSECAVPDVSVRVVGARVMGGVVPGWWEVRTVVVQCGTPPGVVVSPGLVLFVTVTLGLVHCVTTTPGLVHCVTTTPGLVVIDHCNTGFGSH